METFTTTAAHGLQVGDVFTFEGVRRPPWWAKWMPRAWKGWLGAKMNWPLQSFVVASEVTADTVAIRKAP